MPKRLFTIKTIPIFILFLCVAAYGLLSPFLGFYWDDWPMVWFTHSLGPSGFKEVFSVDRPFLAGIYVLTTSLLKTTPFPWQIASLLSRWITALIVWWSLSKLWPTRTIQVIWMAVLFAIFPGFMQQSISVVYSNGFILLAFYISSFGFMLQAIRQPSRYWMWTIFGLISAAICTFSTEYYVGLDLIRPVLIWILLTESITNRRERAYNTIRHWIPYILLMVVFLVWRVLIFKFPTYQPNLVGEVAHETGTSLATLINKIIQDIYTSGWLAWIKPFQFPNLKDFSSQSSTYFWAVVFVVILVSWFFLSRIKPIDDVDQDVPSKNAWAIQAIMVGLLAMFFAGWPFWITNLSLALEFPWDRFSLAFMLGSCIFLVGLIEWLIRAYYQKVIILSIIIGLAVGSNFLVSNTFRRDWTTQKDFFWQLVWRAPGLKPGTIVVTQSLPLTYESDNSMTAPLNWIYAPDNFTKKIPYLFAYTKVRTGASIPALKNNRPVHQKYRTAEFNGNTSDALVILFSPPGCLRVLDPNRDASLPILPPDIRTALSISHLDQIITTASPSAKPPVDIFKTEADHTWCYYFESADLARQQNDWQKVTNLGDEAFLKGFLPQEPSEFLLFVEGYARNGKWDKAMDLAKRAYNQAHNLQPAICLTLKDLEATTGQDDQNIKILQNTQNKLECAGIYNK